MSTNASSPRPIKSFVLRQGRLTKGQQHALENFWPVFGIEDRGRHLDFVTIFGNQQPVTLEIGFGNGDSLAKMAQAAPERNFVGIEVHTPGVGHLLHLIDEYELTNLRILNADAAEVLRFRIPEGSLNCVQIFFPDPWHKKRHNKRRIVQVPLIERVAALLGERGILHMATDWEDYALHMAEVMQASANFFENCVPVTSAEYPFAPRPGSRPLTKFESRGLKLGHGVWDLLYQKRAHVVL